MGVNRDQTESVRKISTVISAIGHPLLVIAIATMIIAFHLYDRDKAFLVSLVVIGIAIIPVTINNYTKTRKKVYTNFDVSDQKQRASFFKFSLLVLGIATLVLYFIPGTEEFFLGTFFALMMLATAAIINIKIKSSIHTSVIFYVAISVYKIYAPATFILFGLGILVGISRLVLNRHTKKEVMVGGLIGVAFGLLLLYSEQILS